MNRMLKKAILDWLCDNKNEWQRVIKCHEVFAQYIYTPDGNYCIGGKEVGDFISAADKLIYSKND